MQLLLGVGHFQLRLGAFDSRHNLLFAGIQLRRFDVVSGFHRHGYILFFLQPRLSPGLFDLCLRRFQSRPVLRQFLLGFCFVKLDDSVALLQLGSVGCDLDDLKITSLSGSRNRYRLHRLHFTAELDRVDEFTTLHLESGNRRKPVGVPDSSEHGTATHREKGDDNHRFALNPQLPDSADHVKPSVPLSRSEI